eukprot:3091984-Pyramimonas_sp.AAC.2
MQEQRNSNATATQQQRNSNALAMTFTAERPANLACIVREGGPLLDSYLLLLTLIGSRRVAGRRRALRGERGPPLTSSGRSDGAERGTAASARTSVASSGGL